MTHPVLKLSAVQQAVRAKVCANCPQRTPGSGNLGLAPRPCESTCALFRNLPRLWEMAVAIDPMVGRFGPAMRRAVHTVQSTESPRRAGRTRRGRAFTAALRELSGK